jgi:hypothetical protein
LIFLTPLLLLYPVSPLTRRNPLIADQPTQN